MDDLISRQAAIDALEREQSLIERPITETRWFDFGLRKAQDVLSELPSAQPERKKGKWIVKIRDNRAYFICSECNDEVDICGYGFCPNCGADMRGEE